MPPTRGRGGWSKPDCRRGACQPRGPPLSAPPGASKRRARGPGGPLAGRAGLKRKGTPTASWVRTLAGAAPRSGALAGRAGLKRQGTPTASWVRTLTGAAPRSGALAGPAARGCGPPGSGPADERIGRLSAPTQSDPHWRALGRRPGGTLREAGAWSNTGQIPRGARRPGPETRRRSRRIARARAEAPGRPGSSIGYPAGRASRHPRPPERRASSAPRTMKGCGHERRLSFQLLCPYLFMILRGLPSGARSLEESRHAHGSRGPQTVGPHPVRRQLARWRKCGPGPAPLSSCYHQ